MGLFDWLFGKQDQGPPAEDDESDQPQIPPTAQRVAARAMALSLVLYRASLEQSPGDATFQRLHARLPDWIADLGLAAELEPHEAALLRAPLGQADPQDVNNASWRAEGLAVLAWALARFELPGYDQMADPRAATASVGFSEEQLAAMDTAAARDLLRHAELGPAAAIGVFRLSPGPMDYVGYLRGHPSFKEHWLEPLCIVDGDLAIGDQAIAAAPAEYVSDCEGSADERRIAAFWLQGDDPIYSKVDPSTILSAC